MRPTLAQELLLTAHSLTNMAALDLPAPIARALADHADNLRTTAERLDAKSTTQRHALDHRAKGPRCRP